MKTLSEWLQGRKTNPVLVAITTKAWEIRETWSGENPLTDEQAAFKAVSRSSVAKANWALAAKTVSALLGAYKEALRASGGIKSCTPTPSEGGGGGADDATVVAEAGKFAFAKAGWDFRRGKLYGPGGLLVATLDTCSGQVIWAPGGREAIKDAPTQVDADAYRAKQDAQEAAYNARPEVIARRAAAAAEEEKRRTFQSWKDRVQTGIEAGAIGVIPVTNDGRTVTITISGECITIGRWEAVYQSDSTGPEDKYVAWGVAPESHITGRCVRVYDDAVKRIAAHCNW